jgi:SAM-dependent methyltransferase
VNPPVETWSDDGLWQLVEFADYTADFPLWEQLATATGGPVLDLGCGIGRVAGHLAGLGHEVVGIDRDAGLVADFNRALGITGSAHALQADATGLRAEAAPLAGQQFALVLAPQQFMQLLGGPNGRLALLGAIGELLAPGGIAAFAICEELPLESIHFPGVLPDAREVGDWYHSSLPVAIEPDHGWITSVRLRQSVGPRGEFVETEDRVRIDRLDRSTLAAELSACGFTVDRVTEVPVTDRHMGSTVLIAGRPDPAPQP